MIKNLILAALALASIAGSSIANAAQAENSMLYLRDGNVMSGEILKNRGGVVVIDNAAGVVSIPKERVSKIENCDPQKLLSSAPYAGGLDSTRETSITGGFQPGKLFAINKSLTPAPIENLVEKYEDGVVQIKTPAGSGSGFIISDDGYVLTNCHVIEKETEITITIFKKTKSEFDQIKLEDIKIVATNPFYDLALLKIETRSDKPFVKCYFAKSAVMRKGESVFAIGNPYGLTRSISQGIVSDSERYISGLVYVQTTAPINAGNSGGPLFNMNGEVVGVINMAYFLADGIGFGIPLNYVYDFLNNVEAYSFDRDNPNTGHMYNKPPARVSFDKFID